MSTSCSRDIRRVAVTGTAIALAIILTPLISNGQQNETVFRSPKVPDTSLASPDSNVSRNRLNNRLQSSQQEAGNSAVQVASKVPVDQSDGFVPEKTPQGFVPVNPRQDAEGVESEVVGEFFPDMPTRSQSDEEILQLLRSGKLDEAFSAEPKGDGVEVIRQRYPNGKIQVERHVAQDADGNFYNQGPWKLLNQRGQILAQGQFEKGVMVGTWERWHPENSGGLFQTKPLTLFKGPFNSTAMFSNGKIDGVWAMFDQFQRKILEIPYQNGVRHGAATWWYPESNKMRVINFKDGLLDGPLYEWDQQNQLVRNEEYIQGKKVIRKTTFYRPNQKQSESFYLDGEQQLEGEDSWWDARPAPYVKTGSPVQHGPAFAWHSNGQPRMRGNYQDNIPVGDFVWWYENGQRELVGSYQNGMKVGSWTGWHANGVKSLQGTFENDRRVGVWIWWDEDGQVRAKKDFDSETPSTGILAEPKDKQDSATATEPPTEGFIEMEEITPIEAGGFVPDPPASEQSQGKDGSDQFRDPFSDKNNSDPPTDEQPGKDGSNENDENGKSL